MKNSRISSTGKNKKLIFTVLAVLLLLTAGLSLCLGAERINIFRAVSDMAQGRDTAEARIFYYARLPRTCAGLLAGASLAAAGAVIQAVLANSLAAPGTIGVNSGAGFAVAACSALIPGALGAVPLAAMLGAFGGTMLVLSIAKHTEASKISLVLAGVAVSAIFSAGTDTVLSFVPEALNGYTDFRIGGLAGVRMEQMAPAALLCATALAAVLLMHNELDVMLLGKEQAQSLGLSSGKMQVIFLALASVLSGASVSFCGLIGFVGLVVPHMMRRIIGEESGPLIMGCVLGGAVILCLCDLLSRLIFAPFELPVGIVMALVGGPFFIWLLRRRGGRAGD